MEETTKWYESKIFILGLAFLVGGLGYFGVQYNLVDPAALESASTVYPEVKRGIDLIIAGQWAAGVVALGGALLMYWRAKKTTKLIVLPWVDSSRRAA